MVLGIIIIIEFANFLLECKPEAVSKDQKNKKIIDNAGEQMLFPGQSCVYPFVKPQS